MLLTDHKPLLTIFGPTSAVPTLAALRMQRWALLLLANDYEIQYCRSCNHTNADALSRLPCNHGPSEEEQEGVFFISHVEERKTLQKRPGVTLSYPMSWISH